MKDSSLLEDLTDSRKRVPEILLNCKFECVNFKFRNPRSESKAGYLFAGAKRFSATLVENPFIWCWECISPLICRVVEYSSAVLSRPLL